MFHKLLDNPKRVEPGRLQADAHQRFPAVVKKSHLQQRMASDPIPASNGSKYVIIGVATYSPDELGLLDKVDDSYPKWYMESTVAVFDVMECKSMSDIPKFVPQLPVLSQTPVVEVWVGGKLMDVRTGLRMTREALQEIGILT